MSNIEPQWGYLINVTPTNEILNLAIWISEFLAEETESVKYDRDVPLCQQNSGDYSCDLASI